MKKLKVLFVCMYISMYQKNTWVVQFLSQIDKISTTDSYFLDAENLLLFLMFFIGYS